MFSAPVTSALFAKRGSCVASGTTMISSPSMACAQNDTSRGVSVMSIPLRAMKVWRVSSTRLTSDTGQPHSAAAKSVIFFRASLSRSVSNSYAAITAARADSSTFQPDAVWVGGLVMREEDRGGQAPILERDVVVEVVRETAAAEGLATTAAARCAGEVIAPAARRSAPIVAAARHVAATAAAALAGRPVEHRQHAVEAL